MKVELLRIGTILLLEEVRKTIDEVRILRMKVAKFGRLPAAPSLG